MIINIYLGRKSASYARETHILKIFEPYQVAVKVNNRDQAQRRRCRTTHVTPRSKFLDQAATWSVIVFTSTHQIDTVPI